MAGALIAPYALMEYGPSLDFLGSKKPQSQQEPPAAKGIDKTTKNTPDSNGLEALTQR